MCVRASSVGGVPTNVGFIPARQPRKNWPDYFLSEEEAVQMQLQVGIMFLQNGS